jgi:hypothetical protein
MTFGMTGAHFRSREAAVTVEDVKIRKEDACLELTEPLLRASVTQRQREDVSSRGATHLDPN